MQTRHKTPDISPEANTSAVEKFHDPRRAVLSSPRWYGQGPFAWRYLDTREEALARRREYRILLRNARRPRRFAITEAEWVSLRTIYSGIADRLNGCRNKRRCGSFACPMCRRAFAQAQYAAFRDAGKLLAAHFTETPLLFVTIIPFEITYPASQLADFRIDELQTVLLSRFAHADLAHVPFFGVLEISYEEIAFGIPYFQPHWHLVMAAEKTMIESLRRVFTSPNPRNPAVLCEAIYDEGAYRYMSKVVEKGYRWQGQPRPTSPVARLIPPPRQREILHWADRTDPMQVITVQGFQILSDGYGLALRPVAPKPPASDRPESILRYCGTG